MASASRKKPQVVDDDIDDLIGSEDPKPIVREKEPDINDLLDDIELPDPNKKLKVEEGTIERKPRIVPIRKDLPLGAFRTQKGVLIVDRLSKYWVVRDTNTGKLYYKEESGVIILPDGWKTGDLIPGLTDDSDLIG